jgi:hypothetical protein
LHSIGRLPDHNAVVESDHCLDVPEEQEGPEVNLHGGDMPRKFRQGEYLHTVDVDALVVCQVPAVNPGIDRYLNGAACSRRVLQEVNGNPSSLALYAIRCRLTQDDFHCFTPALF